ncbi:unnamed protein product [Notodromas monacha]|uniref:HSF-type DNA-binding domain-containing protein n=1 Tax=Notodromas monacha TaxID=399045 RepID=A0A7R9BP77_9CRUS|nr:unnamed protein product [Notodromas monacha]CAG0917636.1 unnamed protein product [Notodromas monacha]
MVESSELAAALAVGNPDNHNSIPGFLLKLRVLVEDGNIDDIIHWGPGGLTFVITNPVAFAEEILPVYFKHNHLASFVRQLNLYGFHKVTGVGDGGLVKTERECLEFRHPYFLRDKPEFLRLIKRKPAAHHKGSSEEKPEVSKEVQGQVSTGALMSVASAVQQVIAKQAETEKKLASLTTENEVLWREIASLHRKNMQQGQMVDKIIRQVEGATVVPRNRGKESQVKSTSSRFLVKLVQRPHKNNRNAPMSPATSGRPIPLMIERPSSQGINRDASGKATTTTSSTLGLSMESGSGSPPGPVIHDVTDLLRSSDGITVLNAEGYKSIAHAPTPMVQVMPSYVNVPSPDGRMTATACSSVGTGTDEPEISMPLSVQPATVMSEDGESPVGGNNVLIIDPVTNTYYAAPGISYVLDGNKVIVNADGTHVVEEVGKATMLDVKSEPVAIVVNSNSSNNNNGRQETRMSSGGGSTTSSSTRKRSSSTTTTNDIPEKRPAYSEDDLTVAVPSTSQGPSSGFASPPEPPLSQQFDVDKFLEYLTSSDAHFDLHELFKIASDPSVANKVHDEVNKSLSVANNNNNNNNNLHNNQLHQQQQQVPPQQQPSTSKILPDLSELIENESEEHESFYKGLEQSEFQNLDTPLADGLD